MKKRSWGAELGWGVPPAVKTIFRRRDLLNEAGITSTDAQDWYSRLSFKELKEYDKTHGTNVAEQLKKLGVNPHIHTIKQLNKMTKKGLIRLVVKLEKFILNVVYQTYKSKLPRLKTIRQKALPRLRKRKSTVEYDKQGRMISFGKPRIIDLSPKALRRHGYTKTKRKFSRKQLAAQRLFAKRARAGTLRK